MCLMKTVYSDFFYKFWFWRNTFSLGLRQNKIVHVKNGIIAIQNGSYGVFDEQFHFVRESFKTRGRARQRVPRIKKSDIDFIDKDVVYMGGVMPHFGHFLLEHFCRAYAMLDADMRDKYVVFANYKDATVPQFVYDMMGLVGVPRERVFIIDKTTRFRNVYVPTQSFDMFRYTSPEYGKIFDYIVNNIDNGAGRYSKKIYISRAKMGTRRILGEEKIQSIFERNGFQIIYPETMSLQDQAAIVGHCNILAGCAGTGLHLALFMPRGGTVIQIKRNRKNKDSASTQTLINRTRGLHGVFVSAAVEKNKSPHYSDMPQIIGMTKYMRKFMDDFGIKYNNGDVNMNQSDLDEYNRLYEIYNNTHTAETCIYRILNVFIKLSACVIPGRDNRKKYRAFLRSKIR